MMNMLVSEGASTIPSMNTQVIVNAISTFLPASIASSIGEIFSNMIMILWYSGVQILIFLSALQKVDPSLYEAAKMDGSNRLQMMLHITIPAILPTIVILLILDLSSLFSANFDQIYNLYNNYVLSTGDVLSTYIYRISLGGGTSFELSTAINLVLQVLGLIVVLITNKFVSKLDIMGIF